MPSVGKLMEMASTKSEVARSGVIRARGHVAVEVDQDDRHRLRREFRGDAPDRLGLPGPRTAKDDHVAVVEPARRPVDPAPVLGVAEEDVEPAGAGWLCHRFRGRAGCGDPAGSGRRRCERLLRRLFLLIIGEDGVVPLLLHLAPPVGRRHGRCGVCDLWGGRGLSFGALPPGPAGR